MELGRGDGKDSDGVHIPLGQILTLPKGIGRLALRSYTLDTKLKRKRFRRYVMFCVTVLLFRRAPAVAWRVYAFESPQMQDQDAYAMSHQRL